MNNGVWLVKYISSAIGNSCFMPFNKENLKKLYGQHAAACFIESLLNLKLSCMSRDHQMVRTSYTFP